MAIKRAELEKYLNDYLNISSFDDYGPNGLHIEGKEEIKTLAFAVSATRESVEKAIQIGADALIVHHGLFWKFHGPKTITGSFAKRVKPLIQNEINLFSYHLPLDGHPEIGNAASIAKRLMLSDLAPFGFYKGAYTGIKGNFKNPIKASELKIKLQSLLNHNVLLSSPNPNELIKNIGIITGGANSEWREAKKEGLMAYLTGEMSEHDWHEAKEEGVHYFAGGHNATEQFGIQGLLKHLEEHFRDKKLEYYYFPSDNEA